MFQCIKCSKVLHKKCFFSNLPESTLLPDIICPTCQLLNINLERKRYIPKFILLPSLVCQGNSSFPLSKTFSFKITMNTISSIKEGNVYLFLTCMKVTFDKVEFKWPKYCNIFINNERLEWNKEEYNNKRIENPFVFYFEDEHEMTPNNFSFTDWFYVDEVNTIEIKKTYTDTSKENQNDVYVISAWLTGEREGKIELPTIQDKRICICGSEEEIEIDLNQEEVIVLSDVEEETKSNKRIVCDLCKKLQKEKKSNKMIIDDE